MKRTLAAITTVAALACGSGPPPRAVVVPAARPAPAPPIAPSAEPAAPRPAAAAAGVSLVVDAARPGAWSFQTPGLPALDPATGAVVVPDRGDDRYAFAAGLVVRFLEPGTKKSARALGVLAQDEYRSVFHEAPEGELEGKSAALETKVRARAAKVSAELAKTSLRALAACSIEALPAKAGEPVHACGGAQRITCGERGLRYEAASIDLGGTLVKTGWDMPPMPASTVASMTGARAVVVPMGDCLSEAFYDASARIFLARVDYVCRATVGDWCSYPPTWRAITLD